MRKEWRLKDPYPSDFAEKFANENAVSLRLLFDRGIHSEEEKKRYFEPDYNRDLHNPLLFKGMEKAAERIIAAVEKNEKIVVFGDYDADGMCGAAIFNDFFAKINFANFEIYIPDRFKEGYGLSQKAVESFLPKEPKLILTIDCGVTNLEEIDFLRSRGIDVIVIDHHLVPPKWPNAYAIIDAKQEDDQYPYKFICGAGMAFKTVQAVLKINSFGLPAEWEKWLLDLVCIATIADMVPLTGENRALVQFGLKVIRKTRRPGLAVLFAGLGLGKSGMSEEDIGFNVAPHINAASRMGNQATGFALLSTSSLAEAEWLTSKVKNNKIEQRKFVDEVVSTVKREYGEMGNSPDVIISGNPNWNPGVLGIAANRLLEYFGRPVFLWGKGVSDEIKGSARSAGELSVVEVMRAVRDGFFSDFGGHHAAGGFSVSADKADDIQGAIGEAAKALYSPTAAVKTFVADTEYSIDNVDRFLYADIARFAPFGVENPAPIFWFKNLSLKHSAKIGNDGAHLKLSFHRSSGEEIGAMFWFKGESKDLPDLRPGDQVDVLASVELSRFNGREELRLRVVDYRFANRL